MSAKNPEARPSPRFPESSFKYNPLMHIRVLFVRFIQGLFSYAPEGNYRWTSDDETTEIYVTDEEVIQPTVVERVPTVSLTRGPIQFYNLGLDDLEEYDFALDRKIKGVLIPGTMTVNCCSRVALESEFIAMVISDHLWTLRDLLMKQGFFEVGRGIQIGSPSKAGSIIGGDRGDEFFCTPVSVPYQFPRLSSVTPLNQRVVQGIEQLLQVREPMAVNNQGAPWRGHEYPFSVCATRPDSFAPDARDLNQQHAALQPHPLNPSRLVRVRVVRPNRAGSRLISSRAAIPISQGCVEQSGVPATAFEQKG